MVVGKNVHVTIPKGNMGYDQHCSCRTYFWRLRTIVFHHANEYVTTIVPLFSNPKNNSPQSARSLHFTLPLLTLSFSTRKHSSMPFPAILSNFFEEQWTQIKPPTILFGIVECSFCDNFSRNSCKYTWTCFFTGKGLDLGGGASPYKPCWVAPSPHPPPAELDPLSLTIRADMMKIILLNAWTCFSTGEFTLCRQRKETRRKHQNHYHGCTRISGCPRCCWQKCLSIERRKPTDHRWCKPLNFVLTIRVRPAPYKRLIDALKQN